MKKSFLLILIVAGLSQTNFAQTWGCPERDYKCQLDVRLKALQANPKDPENYYNLGIVYSRAGAHAEAVEAYSMYIAIPGISAANLADGYNNRGIAQKALKRHDLALADYNKAIELAPSDPKSWINRANLNAQLRKDSAALADYDKAIALDPKYGFAYAQRGILQMNLSRSEDALKDFAMAIELDPGNPEPYYNRGTLLYQQKRFAQAIVDFDKYIPLIAFDPVYQADGYMNRGLSHYATGSRDKALADFSKVIELQPAEPKAYKARAIVYREMKRPDLADADEKKAAQLSSRK